MENNTIINYRGIQKEIQLPEWMIFMNNLLDKYFETLEDAEMLDENYEGPYEDAFCFLSEAIAGVVAEMFLEDQANIHIEYLNMDEKMKERGIVINCNAMHLERPNDDTIVNLRRCIF